MKEAFQNIADREKHQILQYLVEARTELELADKEDEAYIVEMLIDVISEKQPGQSMTFRTRDLGL